MRGSYVRISREDLEDWLNSLPHRWSRKQGRAGIYYVHFSENVGCAVSTTIGRDDAAVGKGRGSMSLSLISLVTGRTLNRKAKDRKYFQRTTNWRKTWADGIKHWLSVYQANAGFYDKIAPIEDRDAYLRDMKQRIESIPSWDSDRMLSSFHEQIQRGSLLSDKQVAIIERAEKNPPVEEDVEDPLVEKLRGLYAQARRSGDNWTMDFAQSIATQLKRGRSLSPKQQQIVDDKLRQYRLASAKRIAALYSA